MNQITETLDSVQFLVDAQGNELAVQMSIKTWEILLNWIEDKTDQLEDLALGQAAKVACTQSFFVGSDRFTAELEAIANG